MKTVNGMQKPTEHLLYQKAIGKETIIKRAQLSNKHIKKGHTLTQKEFQQQSKNW